MDKSGSGIYAEPNLLDTAAWEFIDLEKMIAGAEALYGAYPWERYDVIVLPPSFPFGGMENPDLRLPRQQYSLEIVLLLHLLHMNWPIAGPAT